jgi:isopentenyl diphosphate isomerase/L-lactate dehydrogenase-like FMN-dependent dehydrogenase
LASQPIVVADYEALAHARMHPAAWDYYAAGAGDEITLRENRAVFDRMRLRPRVLVDVSSIDTATTVLGSPVAMPILVTPTAMHRYACEEGECATARAAGAAGTLMVAATEASRTLEDIAAAATGPLWFQLYVYSQRHLAEALVRRAEAAGYRAIVLTVDAPQWGHKPRSERTEATIPPFATANVDVTGLDPASLTWDAVAWLRSLTRLPLVLKGILTAEDASLAVEHGVEGIVVSNHGGRQLDSVPATIEALPEVVDAVAGRCEVYLDGGIRRGTDVLKALALGARAVLVGRPILWGLAANGADGARHVLELLHAELESAMALAGRPTLASIDRSLVKLSPEMRL